MIEVFETALTGHLIEPLGIERVLPGEGAPIADSPIEMRTLATFDMSSLPGLRTFDDAQRVHKAMARDGIRLGQPVKCVRLEDEWGGTLRVGLSMPQMSSWASLSENDLAQALADDMARIAATLQHLLAETA